MQNGAKSAPGPSFPRDTFAKLTPGPFLRAHLQQPSPVRPNGRAPEESRAPVINLGSLSYSNGSAVVRLGDTAVVCGVRGEILLASDIPHPPDDDMDDDELIEHLGLIVPNLELSTGCSPSHVPGNPPTSLAQSLSYRISALIHDSHMINLESLRIMHLEPESEDQLSAEGPRLVTKAYWTLYVDILCLAWDGNVFDAAWLAVLAALRDSTLPSAEWIPDHEMVLCSPLASAGRPLKLNGCPITSSFAVFMTASPTQNGEARSWILSDPDSFEEEVCAENLTIVVLKAADGSKSLHRVENHGGTVVDQDLLRLCIEQAESRWNLYGATLKQG